MTAKDKTKEILSASEIKNKKLDLNDLSVIDSFSISNDDYKKGLFKSIFFALIAVFIFFVPITYKGKTDILYGIMYSFMINITGNIGLWGITLLASVTGIASIYGKYIAKSGKIYDYFEGDSIIHPILYLVGGFFALSYTLSATIGVSFPEIIVGSATGGTISSIMVSVFWVVLVGAVTMPFLLNYGLVDMVGSLLEPLMRPIWKVPGRAAVNALASFLSSSSVGVLLTNKLYRQGVYTEREAVLVVTGFSAVSVGFAYMVIETAGLGQRFISVYSSAFVLTFIVSAFIARLPPFNKKGDVYIDGRQQIKADIEKASPKGNAVKTGLDRAAKKSITAPNLASEMVSGIKDGLEVIPKVITLLSCVGVVALIVAETTPFFSIIGKAFEPLLNLLRVPDAKLIAPSFPIGIAEMFLPVILISNNIDIIAPGARYLVTVVSISQIIFFSETIVVMMASKLPLKLWELVVVFFERTIIAIIIGSIFMHLLF